MDNYIANLDDTSSVNVLILLSNEFSNTDLIKSISEKGQDKNVCVTHITYEDLVELIEENVTSDFLLTQLTEFRAFLDQEGLLPKWKYRLDVVNCAAVSLNLGDDRAYLCADTGGAYSHQRARFFGAYKDKKVHHLYTISAVVTVPENLGVPRLKWKNDDSMSDEDLMSIAKELVSKYRRDENASTPLQVFILDNEREVSFIKDTTGGLWGSKVYFHEIARDCKTIDELADYINNKVWSSINEKKS